MKRFLFLLITVNFCALANSKYFEVGDIEVKQSGDNSLVSKQNALQHAVYSAFEKVVRERSESKAPLPKGISYHQIQNCVYDYSIDQEKFSDSVYIGRISYRFYKNKVAALLKPYGININVGTNGEENTAVKLAVYRKDFMRNAKELRDLNVSVEKFSTEKVIFSIEKNRIRDFRELRIKYARLT